MSLKNDNHFEYKNKSELHVTACGETHTIYSNEVEAKKIVIRVEKMQNKECVFPGDHLDYTIKIYNDSNIDIYDPVFYDDIPDGLEYVPDSFMVNGTFEIPIKELYDNRISYNLDTVKANEEVTVAFRTKVV